MTVVRVVLPPHLRMLAEVDREIPVDVDGERPTVHDVLDAIEAAHPVLRGTIRHHGGGERRPLMRFFACGQDLSYGPRDEPLPDPVVEGSEPLLVVGAIAGG